MAAGGKTTLKARAWLIHSSIRPPPFAQAERWGTRASTRPLWIAQSFFNTLLRLHNTLTDGVAGEFNPVVDVELIHEVAAMSLHRLDRKMDDLGDFFFRHSPSDIAQNFALTLRQEGTAACGAARQPWPFGIDDNPRRYTGRHLTGFPDQ